MTPMPPEPAPERWDNGLRAAAICTTLAGLIPILTWISADTPLLCAALALALSIHLWVFHWQTRPDPLTMRTMVLATAAGQASIICANIALEAPGPLLTTVAVLAFLLSGASAAFLAAESYGWGTQD